MSYQSKFQVLFSIYFTKWNQNFMIPYWELFSFDEGWRPALKFYTVRENRYKCIASLLNCIAWFANNSINYFYFQFTRLILCLIRWGSLNVLQWIRTKKIFGRLFLLRSYLVKIFQESLLASKWWWRLKTQRLEILKPWISSDFTTHH